MPKPSLKTKVFAALDEDAEKNDAELAKELGMSETTVRKWRGVWGQDDEDGEADPKDEAPQSEGQNLDEELPPEPPQRQTPSLAQKAAGKTFLVRF